MLNTAVVLSATGILVRNAPKIAKLRGSLKLMEVVFGKEVMKNSEFAIKAQEELAKMADASVVEFYEQNKEQLRAIAGNRKSYRRIVQLLGWEEENMSDNKKD